MGETRLSEITQQSEGALPHLRHRILQHKPDTLVLDLYSTYSMYNIYPKETVLMFAFFHIHTNMERN